MKNIELEILLNKYLNNYNIKDKSLNGLQIGGINKIKKIITSVSLTPKIIKKCLIFNYDTIIVHHGILWKDNYILSNFNKLMIKNIYKNNINMFAWHIPLDIHKKIGNNILLCKKLNLKINILPNRNNHFIICKIYKNNNLIKKIKKIFKVFIFYKCKKKINKICLCCGNGNNFIEKTILKYKIDTYITGEISEINFNIIKQYNINLIIIGHEKSEIYGIKKLGKIITKKFNIKTYNYIIKKKLLNFTIMD